MKRQIYFSTFFLLLLGLTNLFAQKLPEVPNQWVADYANLLSRSDVSALNSMLRAYEDSTSNQIVVAIFPDAQGYAPEQFSIRLAEKWKIGQKGRDNGIIMSIFLKEHKIRMEVGYGLEDKVPDAIAYQIVDNVVSPDFKKGKYFEGIRQGVTLLMQAAAGKYKGIPKKRKRDHSSPFSWLVILLIIIFFSFFGRRRRYSSVGRRGWYSAPFFFGGFGGGSGGGGFGGGGGFSAGGGSFGGGGATGSW
jgi:uncharacterized protein